MFDSFPMNETTPAETFNTSNYRHEPAVVNPRYFLESLYLSYALPTCNSSKAVIPAVALFRDQPKANPATA